MAAFTDQFERNNLKTFRPRMLAPMWPALLVADAREFLKDFTDLELIEIGRALDAELQAIAKPETFPADGNHWIWTRVKPHWMYPDCMRSAAGIRENFSDLNLFVGFHKPDLTNLPKTLKNRVLD